MIEARDITKSYGRQRVLDSATLRVERGQLIVLTGDNGSGKTTLLHVMIGMRRPDAGSVYWNKQPLTGRSAGHWRRARQRWGFLPQKVDWPRGASVGQLLRFHARLRRVPIERLRQWLGRVGLEGTEKQRIGQLSGGMQQRLGIALALAAKPELIVMDEPASSLDPGWRGALAEWVDEQTNRGASALVTSQLHEQWGDQAMYRHCAKGRIQEESAT